MANPVGSSRDTVESLIGYKGEVVVRDALVARYQKVKRAYAKFYEENKPQLQEQAQKQMSPKNLMKSDEFAKLANRSTWWDVKTFYDDQISKIDQFMKSFVKINKALLQEIHADRRFKGR